MLAAFLPIFVFYLFGGLLVVGLAFKIIELKLYTFSIFQKVLNTRN
uniref:Uncharacterized protein n=1 Tax=uncultured Flavobacteriia bacterium TaxID=212695 RepID=H6RI76_9BACT|nr:hypothetical protein VIS_S18BMA40010 [uncultured Flavobacteriia bacterium]